MSFSLIRTMTTIFYIGKTIGFMTPILTHAFSMYIRPNFITSLHPTEFLIHRHTSIHKKTKMAFQCICGYYKNRLSIYYVFLYPCIRFHQVSFTSCCCKLSHQYILITLSLLTVQINCMHLVHIFILKKNFNLI